MSMSQRIYLDKVIETHGITRDIFEGLMRHNINPAVYEGKSGRPFVMKSDLIAVIHKLMTLYIKTADAGKTYVEALDAQEAILKAAASETSELLAEPVADMESK